MSRDWNLSDLWRDPRLIVARRELAALRTEKTILLAILIQLFVAAFASFLVVGLASMYDPGTIQAGGVDVAVAGDETDQLAAIAEEEAGVSVEVYQDREAAIAAFENREVDAVVVTDRLADDRIRAVVTVPDESFRTTAVVVKLRSLLREYETALREERSTHLERQPVPLPEGAPSAPYVGFTYAVLLPLLLFLPVFIGGSVAVDSLAEEIERGTLELLRASPATLSAIVDGKLLAATAPVPAQAGLWIALLQLNGTPIANVPELLAFVAALGTAVAALGLGVAIAVRDRRLAQFLYSSGLLVLFAATLLLPENPANAVARFAIANPGPATYASLAGAAVLALLSVAGLRIATGALDGRTAD